MIWAEFILKVICAACVVSWFRDLGYKRGVKDGYAEGKKDADNWWLDAEREAEQARKEIWREEARRKGLWTA